MRYIADDNGYLLEVSFGAMIYCNGRGCTEYTGPVPTGYTDLIEWFTEECDKLYRWHIVEGVLTMDANAVAPADADWPLGLATQEKDGLMSKADKLKLDTLGSGAGGDNAPGTVLLWSNEDPTSNYGATTFVKQDLDLSAYTAIIVWFKTFASSKNTISVVVPVGVGSGTTASDLTGATTCFASGDNRWLRRYCYASADGVTFGQGEYRTTVSGDWSINNKYLIPAYIYGIGGGGADEIVITPAEIDGLMGLIK